MNAVSPLSARDANQEERIHSFLTSLAPVQMRQKKEREKEGDSHSKHSERQRVREFTTQ